MDLGKPQKKLILHFVPQAFSEMAYVSAQELACWKDTIMTDSSTEVHGKGGIRSRIAGG
jgi:hypothetical protein